jgi:hypothetical protein
MSELREQLQRARNEYAGARYPGDLARDIASAQPHSNPRSMRIWPLAGLAVAASLVLAIWIYRASQTEAPIVMATSQPAELQDERLWYAVESVPSWPSDVGIVPSPGSIVPEGTSWSMPGSPGMPSLETVQMSEENSSNQQTQTEDAS